MKKIRILCFGDSNTWGYIPGSNHERFSDGERFPKLLQNRLGDEFEIIEEGLNSRTLISEDTRPNKEGRNGSAYLIPCLDSHDPIDLVILMLGTNELKEEFQYSAREVGDILEKQYVKTVLNRKSQFQNKYPKLLIVCPPIINEFTEYASKRYKNCGEKSKELKSIYFALAKKNNCYFIDASNLVVGSDGVHMTRESHDKLADLLEIKINAMSLK